MAEPEEVVGASKPVYASATIGAGWIESSVHVMVMPVTIAIVVMIAPVMWMLGSRAHR